MDTEQVKSTWTEEQKRFYLYVHSLIGTYRGQLELFSLDENDVLGVMQVITEEQRKRFEEAARVVKENDAFDALVKDLDIPETDEG